MKHHVTVWLAVLLCVAITLSAAGCNRQVTDENGLTGSTGTQSQKTALTIAGIQGPTSVGLANLMETADISTDIDYAFTIVSSPDEVVGKFSSGEVQIASVPTNLAAKLYKKLGGDVQMLAVNTAGVLYMLENGDTIQSVSDLRGKTIYSTGEGANPEYVLRHILKKNGLDPDKDVTIEFVAENNELITALATGAAGVAMVPEPAVTTVMSKKNTLRVALNMDEEWNKIEPDSGMLMGCVIAKKSFVEKNRAAVQAFLTEYEASVKAASDVGKTAALCAKYGIIASETVAKNAIPRCNLVYLDGADMKTRIRGYYQILFDADHTSVGGAVPDDAFYYEG